MRKSKLERSIQMEPQDWLWATWRPSKPLERPLPAPFNLEDCLARLSRMPENRYGSSSNWSTAPITLSVSREEAHFWLTAMDTQRKASEEDLVSRLAGRQFTGEIPLEKVRSLIAKRYSPLTPRIMMLLARLFPLEELLELFLDPPVATIGKGQWPVSLSELVQGFRLYVAPFLTEEQVAGVKPRLREALGQSQWPAPLSNVPSAVFYLAAYLGLGEELRPLVESWPDSLYGSNMLLVVRHRPQEIVFGLGDPGLVKSQVRRLRLRLNRPEYIRAWLAHTEYSALDWVQESIAAEKKKLNAEALIRALASVQAPETAPIMLNLVLKSRAPRTAREWLESHPEYTIPGLAPLAAGHGRLAEAALDLLRKLRREGHQLLLQQVLDQQPEGAAPSLRSLALEQEPRAGSSSAPEWLAQALLHIQEQPGSLARQDGGDSTSQTPGRTRRIPDQTRAKKSLWINPADLPPLISGCRLAEEQVQAVLLALQQSTLESPHPLVKLLKEHGDSLVLDAFAQRLLEHWLRDGMPHKQKWALTAVGLLGSDPAALKLAPLVKAWRQELRHQLAQWGLECLRAIGTDTALLQIESFTRMLRWETLSSMAAEFLEEIARERGLTRSQLDDYMVPSCGLDQHGSRAFDYGSRQFYFMLDSGMKPVVRDASGKKREDLPSPGVRDNPALAERAIAEWRILKKQVAEVTRKQAARLERAMVDGRNWELEAFQKHLLRHPLLINLVRLLVWGAYDSCGNLLNTFRTTEDYSFANASDSPLELDETAAVGIIHPLHLSTEERGAWGELLFDYQIVPPFPQLGREIYHLRPEEAGDRYLCHFPNTGIASSALMGSLERLGWTRGTPGDGGFITHHYRPFCAAGLTAVVNYFPGAPIGAVRGGAVQQIERCFFRQGVSAEKSYTRREQLVPLEEVNPVMISEVLRDLALITCSGR